MRPSGLGCLTCDLRRLLTAESPESQRGNSLKLMENIRRYMTYHIWTMVSFKSDSEFRLNISMYLVLSLS